MNDRAADILMLAGRFEARGSSAQTLSLARGLIDRGFRVRIVCSDASRVPAERRSRIEFLEHPALEWPVVDRFAWRFLARDLRGRLPDLVHVVSRRRLPCGKWLANVWKRPLLLTVHDYLAPGETLGFDGPWARQVIAVSDSVRQELLTRTALAPHQVLVICGGAPVAESSSVDVLNPQRSPVVGTAGPLEAAKGLETFLQAARQVLQQHPEVQFVIAGAGPEERRLRRLVRDQRMAEHVTFVPNFPDFACSLAAMDIYVLPSLKQGLGTIMLEAMGRGIPVIATNTGGVYSVVQDGDTGLLIPPSDSARLAERILELLRDPLRARTIGERAREMVRTRYPIERGVEETIALYRRVLEDASTAA
jgi:glycosyltransferase involved in cell wall biosynthesis